MGWVWEYLTLIQAWLTRCDFIDKMLVSDAVTGSVDLQVEDISAFGPVSDPSGKMFHGCDISFRILEFEV